MSVNTPSLDDGKYVTTSSISLTGSGTAAAASSATLLALAVVAKSLGSFPGGIQAAGVNIDTGAYLTLPDGTAVRPSIEYASDVSLGLYRSAASTIALSFGTFDLRNANLAFSSGTTAQSASTTKVGQGQMIFSVLSLTTNGAALYFRSGNSTYVWPSSGVIG